MSENVQTRGVVLVVDDDTDIREIISLGLIKHGYSVITAKSGRECLERLRESERPSLVLLDLMMPDMNGWAVCREAAKDPVLRTIPIIILTGDGQMREDRLGTVPIVKKPVDLVRLLALVEQHAR